MPVYEYRCAGCGERFSRLFRSVNAAAGATVACPACGRSPAERALSSFAYHQSLQMKLDSLDPKYDKELDAAARAQGVADPLSGMNLNFNED